MSFQRRNLAGWLALLLILQAIGISRAQGVRVGASVSTNSVPVGGSVVYTILVTNLDILPVSVFVTNTFSGNAFVNEPTITAAGFVTNFPYSDGWVFQVNQLAGNDFAQMELDLLPLEAGNFTNQITVVSSGNTNVTTNLVVTAFFPDSDLAVGLTNTVATVLTNESTVIGLFATNLTSSTVFDVVVSNTLPSGINLLSTSPPTGVSFTNGILVWNVGDLAANSNRQLLATVTATNVGTFDLTASISGSVNDTNLANNTVTNTLAIGGILPANFSWNVETQRLNLQTGLIDMDVRVQNDWSNTVPALRLLVSGLANGTRLYNAIATNSGIPYVQYNSPLAVGANVLLRLEFYVINRQPLGTNDYVLEAQALSAGNSSSTTATNGVEITKFKMTASGFLIEFSATIGKTYSIIYSDGDPTFTNAFIAQPALVAPATRVQWIDSGPPKTISPSGASRIYRVRQED